MTYGELLREAVDRLTDAGVPDPSWDARALLEHAGGPDRSHFPLERRTEVPRSVLFMMDAYVGCRANRVPLQHILGEAWFMGLPFEVDESVLIPRPDTETLVELVLKETADKGRGRRLLDLCTGSGCIGISLAGLGEFDETVLSDLSHEALVLARRNAGKLFPEKRIRIAEGNLTEAVLEDGTAIRENRFHVITSNPPYIPSAEIEALMPEVRDHDPRMALDGGADGLVFYRRLAEEAKRCLLPGGRLYLEIGCEQGAAVAALLSEAGFQRICIEKDLAGLDRVVRAELPNQE